MYIRVPHCIHAQIISNPKIIHSIYNVVANDGFGGSAGPSSTGFNAATNSSIISRLFAHNTRLAFKCISSPLGSTTTPPASLTITVAAQLSQGPPNPISKKPSTLPLATAHMFIAHDPVHLTLLEFCTIFLILSLIHI